MRASKSSRTNTAPDLERHAALFKALSDPQRLRILVTIARSAESVCVCDITSVLPLNQPTVSHHLKVLRECGILQCERRGTWSYYELAPGAKTRILTAVSSIIPPGRSNRSAA